MNQIAVKSPITGTVLEVAVSNGEAVEPGDVLVVIESMKMENEVLSEHSGAVSAISVIEGQNIAEDETLLTLVLS